MPIIVARRAASASSGDLRQLDAAALAAAAGVDLRLDDDDAAAEAAGDLAGFGGVEGDFAARHRHAVPREDGFGLILVDFHGVQTPMLVGDAASRQTTSSASIARRIDVHDRVRRRPNSDANLRVLVTQQ